jgi:PPM family protein phosphatase
VQGATILESELGLEAAADTRAGARRAENQDRYRLLADGRLIVLADGFGGRPRGGLASEVAVEAVVAHFVAPALGPGDLAAIDRISASRTIQAAFAAAHWAVRHAGHEAKLDIPMATTLLIAMVLEREVVIGHVGDCRCYRLRHGFLKQLTEDHRSGPVELAALPAEDIDALRPLVCMPTRAVGDPPAPRVDIVSEPLQSGDVLLLCTNGVSDVIAAWELARLLLDADPRLACERLMARAEHAGSDDDHTAVVVRLSPPCVRGREA